MVFLEAFAVDLSLVVTRGIAELIDDGRTGILVDPGDFVQLAAAMAMLLEDEPRPRAQLSMHAAQRTKAIAGRRGVATSQPPIKSRFKIALPAKLSAAHG